MKALTAISQDEQKKMMESIQRALCLDEDIESTIVRSPSDPESKTKHLRKDWENAPIGNKMNHWVRNLLTTKSEADFLLAAKLSDLKTEILSYQGFFSDFTIRSFGTTLPAAIYEIYRFTRHLYPLYDKLFSDTENLQKMIRQFLDKRIPNVKTSLVDFISVEEMKDIFFHTESRLDLVGEIDSRLRGYFSSLPETLLAELGEGILPLYYIKNIVFFPFSEFFALFHHDIGDGEPVEKPVFQPAEIYPTLDYLEKFYCALYPLRRRTIDTLVYPEVLDFFARMKNGGTFQELGLEDRDSIMSFVEKQMRNIHLVSLRVLKSVPLPALIRYYKEDPYYKLMIYLPKPHLKDFYTNSTRLKVFTDFEDFFAKVRFDIVEDMVHTLFGKEDLVEFEFYMNSNLNLTPKAGLPGFTHHRSLVILSNILRVQYRGFIQEIIHILNRVMTNRLRDSSNIILLHAAGIEELASRIKNFDVSFSPDSEDGKTLIRLKYVVDRDPHQQKVYRNLIATKDKEAKELLEKGVGHLEGLLLGFMGIAKDLVFLKESSKRMPGLEAKVSRAVETLVLAGKAVRYFIALERGSL